MDSLKDFRISYKGLLNGEHSFLFEINEQFFSHFENSILSKCNCKIAVNLEKRNSIFVLKLVVVGSYSAKCDRCLSPIVIPIEFEEQITVKFEEKSDNEDEVLYVDPNDDFIELSGLIYELVHVNIPLRNVRDCESESFRFCDTTMTNYMTKNNSEDIDSNSIWDELKDIN